MKLLRAVRSAEAAKPSQSDESDEAAKPSQSAEAAQAAKPSRSNEVAQAVRSAPLTCGSILSHPRL